jgi:RNA polymerase sigma-70 factor, ECF subfamily
MNEDPQVSVLLKRVRSGDRSAEIELIPLIYQDLRLMARSLLRNEAPGHSLQATALVHEVLMKVLCGTIVEWQNRAHFFAVASRQMRRILVDHARGSKAQKRTGALNRLPLEAVILVKEENWDDILAVNSALDRLATIDERQSQVVEMRFFGGLSIEEIAEVLGVASRTVRRDWKLARAWLYGELSTSGIDPLSTG